MSWLSAAWHWYSAEAVSSAGAISHPHAEIVNPIAAFVEAVSLAWAAVQQARTARRRHQEQTAADRQRRITESFSKAVEQLASEKIEARLGGIYTLERISRESRDNYWTVMETLTAFVRERARWKKPDPAVMESMARYDEAVKKHSDQQQRQEPSTDIAAVLTVIKRRDPANRLREKERGWLLDLRDTDLRGADLQETHLEGADLRGAHLEGAFLWGVTGLTTEQLARAFGDAKTRLPEGIARPAHWPPEAPGEESDRR
jgi:Pentapeptide repeats (8 copies)